MEEEGNIFIERIPIKNLSKKAIDLYFDKVEEVREFIEQGRTHQKIDILKSIINNLYMIRKAPERSRHTLLKKEQEFWEQELKSQLEKEKK